MKETPCKQCILLPLCISKKRIKCSVLWDYYEKVEYKHPELIIFNKICEILVKMETLHGPTYNEYKWYVHGREKMRKDLDNAKQNS